jgi:hypothetical protein
MTQVQVVDKKTGKTTEYYMEDRLRNSLDKKVIPSLLKKDKDYFIAIDGNEGCQIKGSKVMMSDGSYKNIEDIKLGDSILSPQQDGSNIYSKVINLFKFKAKNIYDVYELNRQKRKLYSCSHNHLIPMNVKNKKTKKWEVVHYEAEELYKQSKSFMKNSTTNTMFGIDKFEDKENCEIEPYCLGTWLGDGHFSSNKSKKDNPLYDTQTIVKGHLRNFKSGKQTWQTEHTTNRKNQELLNYFHRDVGITTNDLEVIEYVSKFYPIMKFYSKKLTNAKTYRFSLLSDFAKQLIFYGLEGKGSGEKFIPKKALTSDIEYRKKLLAGLIDTDGYLSKELSYSITTKSEQLSKDIEYLVYSLGGRCTIRKIKKGIKSLGFIGEYFSVCFYLGNINLPILLKRKQKNSKGYYLSANRIPIELKERDGEIVYGFELDSKSHWYISDNYIVTKNSGKSTLAFQLAKYIDPTFDISRIVFTPDEFREAIFKATKGQVIVFDEAFTGFSSRTSLSRVNTILVSMTMQMRQKNLCIIIVLPTFFLLDRYIALFRAKVLIHVFESGGNRGYFKVYNSRLKKLLYLYGYKTYSYNTKIGGKTIWTKFRGRFYGKFALGEEAEVEYRKKKSEALEHTEKNPLTSSQVKFREQRDILIYCLRKMSKMTYQQMENFLDEYELGISFQQVAKICARYGDVEPKYTGAKEEVEETKEE